MNRQELISLYGCALRHAVARTPYASVETDIEDLLKAIHDGQVNVGHVNRSLAHKWAGELFSGTIEGAGYSFPSIDYTTPHHAMLMYIRQNVHAFGAAKSYSQVKALSELLIDSDGHVRSFEQFRDAAKGVVNDYKLHWLQAEYKHAVASGQMAAQWQRYVADSDLFPNLEYSDAGDTRVRPEHHALDGIVLPINDPFWNHYYPPNGWGCRCDVLQAAGSAKITNSDRVKQYADTTKLQPLFKNNVGKTGTVYTAGHPYFRDVDGSLNEMDAVTNYSMPTTGRIYLDAGDKLPPAPDSEIFSDWWVKQSVIKVKGKEYIELKDFDVAKIRMPKESFRESLYSNHALLTTTSPHEMWGTGEHLVFIRYFNRRVSVVITDRRGLGKSFLTFSSGDLNLEALRKGVLMMGREI